MRSILRRVSPQVRFILAASVVLVCLTACGLKDDLYLPSTASPSEQAKSVEEDDAKSP